MPPVSSAFSVYQEKRLKRQKRLRTKKKLHPRRVTPRTSSGIAGPSVEANAGNESRESHTSSQESDGEDTVMHKSPAPSVGSRSSETPRKIGGFKGSDESEDEEEERSRVYYRPDLQRVRDETDEEGKESRPWYRRTPDAVEEISDSIREGEEFFSWMIHPMPLKEFTETMWETKPLHIKRHKKSRYYSDFLSVDAIDTALKENCLMYGKNIDITQYTKGKRETLNPSGRALSNQVWDYYSRGCSVRLLNPQAFISPIGKMLATLQEYFGVFVGANVYLTPPNAQGFAPHYDDIEAFVLQIEGKKRWKIYRPWKDELLPRDSSRDYRPEELPEPVLDTVLSAGELLYFPRGWIHEAHTVPGHRSLHITVSCYQHQAWIDFFEKVIPAGLAIAATDVEFRRGLPLGYLRFMGLVNSDRPSPSRDEFLAQLGDLIKKFINILPVDACVDQLGRQFMHDALPPVLRPEEMKCSVFDMGKTVFPDGQIVVDSQLHKKMKIKLVRASVLRVVQEESGDGTLQLYHSATNSMVYHECEEHMLEINEDEALMVEYLINAYPLYTKICDLPPRHKNLEAQKVQLAELLFNHGILLVTK